MASRQFKQESSNEFFSKRINYSVPPGMDPLNVRFLMNMSMWDGYSIDYLNIVKIFHSYRYEPVTVDGWRGFAVSTAEFVRALTIGTMQTVRKRVDGSQTEVHDPDETQWLGGSPVVHDGFERIVVRLGSPDLFSDISQESSL